MTSLSEIGILIIERKATMFHTEIVVKGKINPHWSDWFEGLQIDIIGTGDTLLCGELPDKSAVYGVISRLGGLGISLISVTCQEDDGDATILPDPAYA
jgi:hypothetical protein